MDVEDKEKRPKNRVLGNTEVKPLGLRSIVVYSEGHKLVSNIGANHWKARSITPKVVLRRISSMS